MLAVIPARGNSKRLPGKNLKKMNGVSLLERAVALALQSSYIDLVVVSSEDDSILEHAENCGAVTLRRPDAFSRDATPTIDPVLHACEQNNEYGIVVLLQPTSPLRSEVDLHTAFGRMAEMSAKQVISVCELDHPVQWNMRILNSGGLSFLASEEERARRSQDYETVYRLNGAIYISDVEFLKTHRSFVTDQAVASVMPRERSVDVDTQYDFSLAEAIENILGV